MQERKIVLAVCGSTRAKSSNGFILEEIAARNSERIDVRIFSGLAELPHFNPDLDRDEPPAAVQNFRELIEKADALLICTPEYVFALPGSLKNALDWLVSTTICSDKPAAFIVASGLGDKAFESLDVILRTIGTRVADESKLLVRGARTRIDDDGRIVDEELRVELQHVVDSLIASMSAPA